MSEIKRRHPGPVLCRAVEYGNLVFIAGTTADNKAADAKGQTEEILKKIDGFLVECGSHKSKILSANVWVANMSEKPLMDAAWTAWVDPNNKPVRACVEAKLGSADTRVEIMVTAAK
ncbi:MAG: RidA family protein [Betaproteobacteria bacterium]|nr:RidA family protein [Betaproteobacteria bacterium]